MPSGWEGLGRLLIIGGLVFVLFGLLLTFRGKVPFLGRLPGDLVVQKGKFRFFFPLVTPLVLSLVLALLANIVLRALGK